MLVHSVYFWWKPNLSAADRAAFRAGLEKLRAVETVRQLYLGTPAPTKPRDVIDTSYDLALTVLFDSVADQNTYQDHPRHNKFIEENRETWAKVRVFDSYLKTPTSAGN